MAQEIFERYEKKYLLPERKAAALAEHLTGHMEEDRFGRYTVSNLYYDTEDYLLIRECLEKPVYKEKLRLRAYGIPGEASPVFLEIKKKFRGVVYKRRIELPLADAEEYLDCGIAPDLSGKPFTPQQIFREIDYMRTRLLLLPAAMISYDRSAYAGRGAEADLRVTFDTNIRCRSENLSLKAGPGGTELLPAGVVLMEVKIPGAMPLWMAELFQDLIPYQRSFSKYGSYYTALVNGTAGERRQYAA